MLSSQKIERVDIEIFDADGCLYNLHYQNAILACIYLHTEWVQAYRKANNITQAFTEEQRRECKEKAVEIINTRAYCLTEDAVPDMYRVINRIIRERAFRSHSEQKSTSEWMLKIINEFINYLYHYQEQALLGKICLVANQELIHRILARKHEFDTLVIALGSNRQTYDRDKAGMVLRGTGSIYIDLTVLFEKLQRKLKDKKVIRHTETTADIYAGLAAGTSYENILAFHQEKLDVYNEETVSSALYDDTKLSILYAVLHAINAQFDQGEGQVLRAKITAHFYDDLTKIIDALRKHTKNTKGSFIPRGTTLNLHCYQGEFIDSTSLVGTGESDANYRANILRMASLCEQNIKKGKINFATQLNTSLFFKDRVTKLQPKQDIDCREEDKCGYGKYV